MRERFYAKTQPTDSGCLEWTAAVNNSGYGTFQVDGSKKYAHRVVWEMEVGPIPTGLVIDHLCRNRKCVQVSHLRVVTHQENLLAGETLAAANSRKTACPKGHDLHQGSKARRCRACGAEATRLYKLKTRG